MAVDKGFGISSSPLFLASSIDANAVDPATEYEIACVVDLMHVERNNCLHLMAFVSFDRTT